MAVRRGEWTGREVILMPLPISSEMWAYQGTWVPPAQPTILFVGARLKAKGLGLLLDSVEMLVREDARVKLTVVGPMGDQPVSRASYPFVCIKGVLESIENVISELRKASVLVLPSQNEGIPRSIVEGIIVGVPVIFSGSDYLARRFPKNVAPASPEKLARVLKDALARPQRYIIGGDISDIASDPAQLGGLLTRMYTRAMKDDV